MDGEVCLQLFFFFAFSTAEAEYIALSQALRETNPMTNLMREYCQKNLTDDMAKGFYPTN